MAADHVDGGGPGALEGHVQHVDLGGVLEQFAGEMRHAADTRGGILQLARLFFGQRDQFLDHF